jgi:hypothetical protein
MKVTKCALMVASVMAALTSIWWGYLAVITEKYLCNYLVQMHEEGLEKMQAVQERVAHYHHAIYFQLAAASWYLVLAGLLIFLICRLRISN